MEWRLFMEIIKANNVVYEYIRRDEEGNVEGITRAVNDVSLDIEQGQFIEFCLYSKRQFLRKKYKNIRFCYVKSLYFRYTSKIKKFRTKNPDFGTFLYGICCFGAFYTKLTCYLFSFSFSSGWKSAKVERFVSFPNIQV